MSPEPVDLDIPGISELTEGIKTAEARAGHLAVPDVTTWKAKEPTLNCNEVKAKVEDVKTEVGTVDAKCGNCSKTCTIQQELKK